jgi:hypothetical protein
LVDDSISLLGNIGGKNSVGWCPQHDILFDELTPIEHVLTITGVSNTRFDCMHRLGA